MSLQTQNRLKNISKDLIKKIIEDICNILKSKSKTVDALLISLMYALTLKLTGEAKHIKLENLVSKYKPTIEVYFLH